jgi:hypothetical protein
MTRLVNEQKFVLVLKTQLAVICLSLALGCTREGGMRVTDGSAHDLGLEGSADAVGACSPTALRGVFSPTGGMTAARGKHAATSLSNGTVLVTGGDPATIAPPAPGGTAEIYDALTATFAPTGALSRPRTGHTATLLPNGKVLVAGGTDGLDERSDLAGELFDASGGIFSVTGGLLAGQRVFHSAALLLDGRVLVAGGQPFAVSGFPGYASAELYDSTTGAFTLTGSMTTIRVGHTATLLADGRVLVTGGIVGSETRASADLYDPVAGRFVAAGNMTVARHSHTATLLGDGKVLIVGGADNDYKPQLVNAELYDPTSGEFAPISGLATSRFAHTATVLTDGEVLVAGGLDAALKPLSTSEIFNPQTRSFAAGPGMVSPRSDHTATLLCNGKVLLTGGGDATGANLSTAEVYE